MKLRSFAARCSAALAVFVLSAAGYAAASPITVNKAFTPTSVNLGQASTVTVTFQNNDTTQSATITAFKDDIGTMNGGAIVNGAYGAFTTCAGGTPTIVGNVISMNNGVIPAASSPTNPGTCTITFQVFGDEAGNSVNTINASDVNTTLGGPPGSVQQTLNVASANIPVSAGPSQTVAVGASAPSPPATLTFTITNPAPNISLTNVAFPINLSTAGGSPPYTFMVTGANAGTCGGTAVLPPAGSSGTVAFSGVTVPPSGSCTITLTLTSSATITNAPNTVNLQLPSSGITTSQGITNSGSASNQAKFVVGNPNISKSFSPSTIQPGQTTTLTINIQNILTAQPLTNAAITDNLPSGLTVASPSNAVTTCGSGTVNATPGGAVVALSGGTVAPNSTCTIKVSITTSTPGSYTNTIPASSFTSDQVNGAAQNATATLTTTGPGGGVSLGKSVSPSSVGPNTPVTFTLTFNSVANGAFTHGTFVDDLPQTPQPMAIVGATASQCGGTITATPGSTSVSGSGLSIPAGGKCTVTFQAQFTTPPPGVNRTDTNTLLASNVSFTGSNGPYQPGGNASVNITELPVITLQNYLANGQTLINEPVTVQALINDASGTTDTNLNATFNLTPGKVQLAPNPNFTFSGPGCAGISSSSVTIGPNGESFTVFTPTISASCTIGYNVIDENGAAGTFNPGTSSYTSALTGCPTGGPGGCPQSQPFPATNAAVFQTSNINITKVFTPNQIQAGSVSTAGISVSVNNVVGFTTTQANGVTIPDALPSGLVFAPVLNATFSAGCQQAGQPAPTYAVTGTTITASNISLIATSGGSTLCTFSFNVTSATLGAPVNQIPAKAITSISGVTNSQAVAASLTVAAGVAIQKTFVSPTLQIGSTDYMRLLLTNSVSPNTLTAGTVSDTMPTALALTGNTLGPAQPGDPPLCGGAIAGSVGSNVFQLTGVTIPPLNGQTPGQCVFYVPVGASATAVPGSYTNTIPTGGLLIDNLANQTPTSATVTLTAPPGVTISKAFAPTQIPPGGTSVMTIGIANTSAFAAPLSALTLSDALPAGVLIAPTPNASTTCGSGTVAATAGGSSVALSGGSIAANATCTITVSVTAANVGSYVNTIPANNVTTAQGASNAAPASATLVVANAPGLTLSKSFSPNVIAPGGTSTLTVSIANSAAGAIALSALSVKDTLPANITIAPAPGAATTCTGGTVAASPGGSSVALSGGSLAANATCTVTVSVTGTIAGTYTNVIPANSVSTAQGATNPAPAQAPLTIGQPALAVKKTSSPSGANVSPGQTIAYTVTVTNGGSQTETNAHITDTLTNATLVSGSVTVNGAAAPDAIVTQGQSFGSVPPGATVTIAYNVTVNANAPNNAQVANNVTVGGDQGCTGASCTSSPPPNIVKLPVLTIGKVVDGQTTETVLPGQIVTYGLTVANTGSTAALNAVVTDVVPSGVTPVQGSVTLNGAPFPGATFSGQTLTAPLGTLAAGASDLVTFKAKPAPGTLTAVNTASVVATGANPVVSNPATIHVVPPALSVTKTASATVVSAGDRVNFTIVVAPLNNVAYAATTVVDVLPDFEIYAPGTARVGGKPLEPAVVGQTLTWTLPSLSSAVTITYAVAIGPGAPANGTLTNTVNVSASSPGGGPPGQGAASASVLVTGTTLGSCYPITGRVYLDAAGTARFEDPDVGLPNVHIYLDNGESVITDSTGRYSFPCVHPGMHALRLDESTLPSGVKAYADRSIDSEKSTRRLVHRLYDTTIIEDVNFAVTGKP